MSAPTSEFELYLYQRVQSLERQLSFQRWTMYAGLTFAGLAIVIAALAIGLARANAAGVAAEPAVDSSTLEAKAFVIRDDAGNLRANLTMTEDGPALTLYDEEENARVVLAVRGGDPGLILADPQEKTRLAVFATATETTVRLNDSSGAARAQLGTNQIGEPGLTLYHATSRPMAALAPDRDGVGLELYDDRGRPRAQISVGRKQPRLRLLDELGQPLYTKP